MKPLRLPAAASVDTGLCKTIVGSGSRRLVISDEGGKDIIKIIKSLETQVKDVGKTTKVEPKEQQNKFLTMLLEIIRVTLLKNMLNRLSKKGVIRAGDRVIQCNSGSCKWKLWKCI